MATSDLAGIRVTVAGMQSVMSNAIAISSMRQTASASRGEIVALGNSSGRRAGNGYQTESILRNAATWLHVPRVQERDSCGRELLLSPELIGWHYRYLGTVLRRSIRGESGMNAFIYNVRFFIACLAPSSWRDPRYRDIVYSRTDFDPRDGFPYPK